MMLYQMQVFYSITWIMAG